MLKGTVTKSTGSRYEVLTETGESISCHIRGSFRIKGIKNTNPISVGDKVGIEMEKGEASGIIVHLEDRRNYIIRKSINLSKQTHILAANLDQAMLIVTLVQPRTSTGFIDRFLVTAEAYSIPTIIIFNKTDIYDAAETEQVNDLVTVYSKTGYPCLLSSVFNKRDTENIRLLLKGKTTLLSGHSGAGKSSLINEIEPGLGLKTGKVSKAHDKGIHTTTFAEMFPLSFGGFIIDTPGIKELGIVDIKKEELSHFFPEMRERMNDCKFNNCLHVNEPKCAVIEAVEKGTIAISRYNSYLSILSSEEMDIKYDKG